MISPMTWSLVGLGMTLVGGISYFFLLDVPFIRNTAIPNVILVVLGMGMAVYGAIYKPGKLTVTMASVSGLVGLGLIVSLFVLMKLPAPEAVAQEMSTVPDFTLVNQSGQTVSLAATRGMGPVLLVFYRGHW